MTLNIIPLVVTLLGLVLYIFPTHAKTNEVGRILFFVGALALLLTGGHAITIK